MSLSNATSEQIVRCTTVIGIRRGPRESVASWWSPLRGRLSGRPFVGWAMNVARRAHADRVSRRSWSGRARAPSSSVTCWGKSLAGRGQLPLWMIFLQVCKASILLLDYRRLSLNRTEQLANYGLCRSGIFSHFVGSRKTIERLLLHRYHMLGNLLRGSSPGAVYMRRCGGLFVAVDVVDFALNSWIGTVDSHGVF